MNKVIRKIESFLQTDGGQRLLQYGYSFGAAIVIFGAMVKVLHLWGIWGNIIFGTGMAIEVVVFILYGLDRPAAMQQSGNIASNQYLQQPTPQPQAQSVQHQSAAPHVQQIQQTQQVSQPYPAFGGDAADDLASVSENVAKFATATATLTKIAESLQDSYRFIIDNSQDVGQNTMSYVNQMEALNRNISGLNTIYEIQLKSISGQIGTLDEINKGLKSIREMYGDSVPDSSQFRSETERMTLQIRELNNIYGRLIQAMTSNKDS